MAPVAVTSDLKAALSARLVEARARTLSLLAPVPDEELVRQHSTLMSPLVWDLAHIGHFEELWLIRRLTGSKLSDGGFDHIYDACEHDRAERSSLPLLSPDEARHYVARVRERALEVLDGIDLDSDDPLLRAGFVYRMIIQHEHQHNETLLATLQLREAPYPISEPPAPAEQPAPGHEIALEGGRIVLGTDDNPWAYDNERPEHEVEVAAFRLDRCPVTNSAYAQFVADGGYEDARLWAEAGWAWRTDEKVQRPQFWIGRDGEWARRRFGRTEELPSDEPVQHVSWYEADAYARWAGKRLPTEPEWEYAASADGMEKSVYPWGDDWPGEEHANLALRFGPTPVGAYDRGSSPAGVLGLIGDVWEWTSSDFRAYPGFTAFPYLQYSETFFGSDYKVLRGGSWATHPTAIRSTFRNWDFPIRRQIFAGFRCARDA